MEANVTHTAFDAAKVDYIRIYTCSCNESENPFLVSAFQVQYKKEYEKNKAQSDYNTLPATDNPLLRQLRYAGTILSDVGISIERPDT